ncbi:hypothetical protein Y032_0632g878 [Ancylostoma ceylanicum]|uniref:Uncharacterized protein n=1 Tax=Ancylostoma ceylanicum TaxID=53326 RepID=A0A016WM13_9BILA|nr:hypothetical protein Y032_0632g878 [Ancylostoma ceylanicum]
MLRSYLSTTADLLYALEYRRGMAQWTPYELTDANRAADVSICQSLPLLPNCTDFLGDVVTVDEGLVRYY